MVGVEKSFVQRVGKIGATVGRVGAGAGIVVLGAAGVDAISQSINNSAPTSRESAYKPPRTVGGIRIIPHRVEAGALDFRVFIPYTERSSDQPVPPTPTPTATETPAPHWTEEQLLANSTLVEPAISYTDPGLNWTGTFESRKVNGAICFEHVDPATQGQLMQFITTYGHSDKFNGNDKPVFRKALFIVVNSKTQIPADMPLWTGTSSAQTGRFPMGKSGAKVYGDTLFFVLLPDPNLPFNEPQRIAEAELMYGYDFLSAVNSGGDPTAGTEDTRDLARNRPLKLIKAA